MQERMKVAMGQLREALPFWLSIILVPLYLFAMVRGGWWPILVPLYAWVGMSVLDRLSGLNLDNKDPDTDEGALTYHRMITLIWPGLQLICLFGTIAYLAQNPGRGLGELLLLIYALSVLTGTIGINYAHELMHQQPKIERALGDILLAMVLYAHFRSEHLLVHHRRVGTPGDAVTAGYGEGFYHFLGRVLISCPRSAWRAEKEKLARVGRPVSDGANPFWWYAGLQLWFVLMALLIGGWLGLSIFIGQAIFAVVVLEAVNYVEHYGLTRKRLPSGKYEPVAPRHSWNAAHRFTNYLLINLQRHSDHHYKPSRRYPLLQNYTTSEAPQLPYGYAIMTTLAFIPPLWRKVMNPRVRLWRECYYPEVTDWRGHDRRRQW